ncbi:MAG: alpha-L-glutamate ligase-like protein [Kiritimatiellia bacterium]
MAARFYFEKRKLLMVPRLGAVMIVVLLFMDIYSLMIDTLSGVYSLAGQPDTAMIEYRVKFDPVFADISYQGVPDVRIIVFKGVPTMAMVRLPTRQSGGKANLHQNAIGAGIDIATGKTLSGVQGNCIVTAHPDTRSTIVGVQVPSLGSATRDRIRML